MKFNNDLEPYLLSLQQQYTKYKLGYVVNFKSEYSFRIYELLKEYERIGERTLTVQEIKEYLMLDSNGTYSKYSHFKTRVILKSIAEINKYSDLKVELLKENKERKKGCGVGF